MSKMHASVCRYRPSRKDNWQNGILVRVDTPDTRLKGGRDSETTVTVIGVGGYVYYPTDLESYDELYVYGAFTFDPEAV